MVRRRYTRDEALARGQPEEYGGGAEDDGRGRELSGVEVVAEDAEADSKGAGGDVGASAEERGEDLAYREEQSDDAGDPACKQPRLPSPVRPRVTFRHAHLSLARSSSLSAGGLV